MNSTVQVNDLSGPAWAMGPTLTSRDGAAFIAVDLGMYIMNMYMCNPVRGCRRYG